MIAAAAFIAATVAVLTAIKRWPRNDPRDDHWRNNRPPS